MSQDCGGRAGEVGTQNIIRKKCLVSLESTSDSVLQKLFTCTYTFTLCNFHLLGFFLILTSFWWIMDLQDS